MKTADSWCDELFGEPWQKSDTVTLNADEVNQLFRRIQADALRSAADIAVKAIRPKNSVYLTDAQAIRSVLNTEADKLEL